MVYLGLIKDEALKNNIPIMHDDTLAYLVTLISEHGLNNILEIGSATGYSSIYLASHTKALITTIEKDRERYEQALKNIKESNLIARINIIHADALSLELTDSFDLIIIDAAKTKHQLFFNHFLPNLSEKGYIMTDNLGLGCTKGKPLTKNRQRLIDKTNEYITFLSNNLAFETEFLNLGDQISISKRK